MRRLAAVLPVVLAALALPASAAAVPGAVTETITVPTSMPGVTLNAQLQRPAGDEKVPIVLTFTPYGSLAEPDPSDDAIAAEYVPQGYARVVADTPGTRGSTGCWDYGGPIEQQAGRELVTALSKLPWSNGKVALLGVSYEGTTANMLAADGDVPGLAAIVPIAAISRWYGYAYQSGVRYAGNTDTPTDEGLDTPLGFDFGFGRTPPPDPSRPQAPQALFDRTRPCDSVAHTQQGYARDPDYTAFWRERDYLARASAFRVPVLLAHGWQDYNVKQSEGTDLYEAIPVDDPSTAAAEGVPFKRLYMFQDTHAYPNGEEWAPLLRRFLARTLKGEDNGVDREEPVQTFARDHASAETTARDESAWPPAGTGERRYRLGRSGGAGVLARSAAKGTDTFTDLSTTTEEVARRRFGDELSWLAYETAPLTADMRLAGSPQLDVVARIAGARAQLDAVLVDLAPDGTSTVISRGFSDVRYRDGLESRTAIPQDADVRARVRLAPQDQVVRAGHRIGLIVSGSNTAWAVPDDPGARFGVRLGPGGSELRLPVVGVR